MKIQSTTVVASCSLLLLPFLKKKSLLLLIQHEQKPDAQKSLSTLLRYTRQSTLFSSGLHHCWSKLKTITKDQICSVLQVYITVDSRNTKKEYFFPYLLPAHYEVMKHEEATNSAAELRQGQARRQVLRASSGVFQTWITLTWRAQIHERLTASDKENWRYALAWMLCTPGVHTNISRASAMAMCTGYLYVSFSVGSTGHTSQMSPAGSSSSPRWMDEDLKLFDVWVCHFF